MVAVVKLSGFNGVARWVVAVVSQLIVLVLLLDNCKGIARWFLGGCYDIQVECYAVLQKQDGYCSVAKGLL